MNKLMNFFNYFEFTFNQILSNTAYILVIKNRFNKKLDK